MYVFLRIVLITCLFFMALSRYQKTQVLTANNCHPLSFWVGLQWPDTVRTCR